MTVPTELLAMAEAHEASYIRKIKSLTAENERLRKNLGTRDDFLVKEGLWNKFVGTLPYNNAKGA